MVHRVPTAVWSNKAYQDWMASFGPDTQHAIATTDGYRNDIAFTSSAWNVLQLSLIDGDLFSLPHAITSSSPDASSLPPNVTFLRPNHNIKLNPPGKLELLEPRDSDVPFPTTLEAAHNARRDFLKSMPEFALECAKAREAVRKDPRWGNTSKEVGDDIVVTTLGTGSAIPSKYRNVSSTHLDIPDVGGILLDCGEGTLGQMRRKYGLEGMKALYSGLRMIFVSHMHADHHLGLQAILEDRFAVSSLRTQWAFHLMTAWHHLQTLPCDTAPDSHQSRRGRSMEPECIEGSAQQHSLDRQQLRPIRLASRRTAVGAD